MSKEFLGKSLGEIKSQISTESSEGFPTNLNKLRSKVLAEELSGEKTAAALIKEHADLRAIFKSLNKIQQRIEAGREADDEIEALSDEVFDLLSDINADLLIFEAEGEEKTALYEKFALAAYLYEEFIVPLEAEKNAEAEQEKRAAEKKAKEEMIDFKTITFIFNENFAHLEKALAVKSKYEKVTEREIENLILDHILSVLNVYIDFSSDNDEDPKSVREFWKKSKKRTFRTKAEELLKLTSLSEAEQQQVVNNLVLRNEAFKEFLSEEIDPDAEIDESEAEKILSEDRLGRLDDLYDEAREMSKNGETDKDKARGIKEELDEIYDEISPVFTYPVGEGLAKKIESVKEKYHQAVDLLDRILNPEVFTMSMEDIVKEIKKVRMDPFRWSEVKSPSSAMSEKNLAVYNRFIVLANTPVYSSEDIRAELLANGAFDVVDNKEDNDTAKGLLMDYFDAFSKKQTQPAKAKLAELKAFLSSKGVAEARMNEWGLKIYEDLHKKETERLYWKVNLQLHAMSNEMEHEGSASRERSMLYAEMKRCLLRRDEMLAATTYHPEHGDKIRESLKTTVYQAALRKNEFVVRRKVRRQNVRPDLTPFTEETEVLQKVISLDDSKEGIAAFRKKLIDSGEEIVYEADPDGLAQYNSLATTQGGAENLDSVIARSGLDAETQGMTANLFKVFDLLTLSLAELQKNTATRAHNASIDDKDRISLLDPVTGAIHRMYRYEGNPSDWAMYILIYFDKLQGDVRFYSEDEYKKKKFAPDVTYINASGAEVNDESLTYHYGKQTEDYGDHQELVDLQHALREYAENYYDWFQKVPTIRQRGFCEPLGYSTMSLVTLNEAEKCTSGEDEIVFGPKGAVGPDGQVKHEVKTLEDLIKVQSTTIRQKPTEFALYGTAEENGILGLLEQLYGTISEGQISVNDLFTGKALIHGMYKTWGRMKMFPGGMREMFVPFSYDYIMRVVHSCSEIDEPAIVEDVWAQVVSSLIENMEDNSGLTAFKPQLATLINLLCREPIYKEETVTEDGKKKIKYVRTGNHPEPSLDMYHHGDRFSKHNRFKVTQYMLDESRKGKGRVFGEADEMMDRPQIIETTGTLKNQATVIGHNIQKGLGLQDYHQQHLIDLLKGKHKVGRPVNNNGTTLVQEKTTDKK